MTKNFKFVTFLAATLIFFASCTKDPKPDVPPIAIAGNSQIIKLPSSLSLTGSGTSVNGRIVGYLWSLVSGPNVPVITSPSSAATTVTGLSAGTYIMQLAVTDNIGLTGVDTVSIVVNPGVPPIADAGISQTIQLPDNTANLAGTGTTTNGSITTYLWSIVSGPGIPSITSPNTAATIVTGLVAGTYVMKLTVTDNVGLTGTDTLSLVVNPPVQHTITIQPTSNPNDAHVDSYNPAGGAGDTELEIGAWTIYSVSTQWRSYLKFDQSQIPSGSTIVSATLSLYSMPVPHAGDAIHANYGLNNSFSVERITASWNPSTLAWSNLPAVTTTNKVDVAHSALSSENVAINVTNIVQDMLVNGNYGFAFQLQNEVPYNFRTFASSTYTNAALHPKLVITYQ